MMSILSMALSLTLVQSAMAADPDAPHPHQGLVRAYEGKPEKPRLTQEDLGKLNAGDPVLKQIKDGAGAGRGMAVQDIHATPEVVWGRITDYAKYPVMVDNVKSCETYGETDGHIKAKFVITAMMMNVEYYIDHVYKPDEGFMTWTLDYTRDSDLDDSVGFWLVEAIADKPGWTRVYYSVEVKLRGWVPAMVENMVAKQGLPKATAWVKRESEILAGTSEEVEEEEPAE
jgi:hypothetical protein